MVKVAIAGGTGGLGRHVVEGILETKKHDVLVLSRSSSHPALEALGAKIVAVDYTQPATVVAALSGVHTVISTLSIRDLQSQLTLVDAAVQAGVTRFAPSEWAVRSIPDNPIEPYRAKWVVSDAVRKSGLEYTIFENGLFMNYLAVGTPGLGHLKPVDFIWNVDNCTAAVPGDGSAYLELTRAEDVGKFVAASLDWEKWPEFSQMKGDRKTLNEVVKLAEAIRGKPFDVTYLLKEKLNEIINDPSSPLISKFMMQCYLEIVENPNWDFVDANLNSAFPDVQPMGVEEFLKKWWA